MPLLVILDFLSALLPKKIALQNFLYNLCVWESSNRTQHLRMSSNHKGSVSTQRYLMLVKLQGVFGSPSFRKIRFTIHIQVQMTTRCNWSFLQTVQRGCSAFNAVGANSTLNKFIWNFPSSCTLTLNQLCCCLHISPVSKYFDIMCAIYLQMSVLASVSCQWYEQNTSWRM